jgi:uncharacterized membrane protein YgdD (TMEM256/DUF423 family)
MIAVGALLVAVAIGLGAWHAHGLAESLNEYSYTAFGRGIDHQKLSGVGLILCGFLFHLKSSRWVAIAAHGLLLSAILFSGDVYLGALKGESLGVAPFGGSLSILSWLLIGISQLLPGAKRSSGALL